MISFFRNAEKKARIRPHGGVLVFERGWPKRSKERRAIASLVARNPGGVVYTVQISLHFSCPILDARNKLPRD